jgi:bacteriorhodopsin
MSEEDTKTKEEDKPQDDNTKTLKNSFLITYILLLTTATITLIEALRTTNPTIRHIFNLETCISVVAGYFYSLFIKNIESKDVINWANITKLRYIDWAITTPMMLLALCLVLSYNIHTVIHLPTILLIVGLNYAMLLTGYLGETNILERLTANISGFLFFFAMFYLIYVNYVQPRPKTSNYVLYGMYFSIWSLYGIVYLLDETWKNITTNILDLSAKCLVGLGLWVYYTHIIKP